MSKKVKTESRITRRPKRKGCIVRKDDKQESLDWFKKCGIVLNRDEPIIPRRKNVQERSK